MKVKTKSRKKPLMSRDIRLKLPIDYQWKVLGWLTRDLGEFLTESDKTRLESIIRNRDVDSYLALSEEWGLQCNPTGDIPYIEFCARYQLTALLKKFRFPTSKDERLATAKQKFYNAELACKAYNGVGFKSLVDGKDDWDVNVFHYAKSFLKKLLGERLPSGRIMTEWSRHGPGATLDTYKGQNSTYCKYENWPYSCTSGAYRYACYVIETDQRWLGALMDDYRERFNIPKHYPISMKHFWRSVIRIVPGNKLAFVPKNALTERSIAIEPTMNLFLQLGVDGYIRNRLKRFGINLDSQEKNQRLARLGSFDGPKSPITVDLSAASDSISLKLCEVLLPEDWYNYLLSLRSPIGDLNGDIISYEKISSMGNGYTFVLESAIFAAIIYAVSKAESRPLHKDEYAVYGDDLIVPKDLYHPLVRGLDLCGFTINSEKSFFEGYVRESCGSDWFRGTPIRPVFFQDAPTTVMELFNDFNRLKRILSLRYELEESETLRRMEPWIPEAFRNLKGPISDEDFDSYIHTDTPLGEYKSYVWEYKRLIVKPQSQKACKFLFRKLMHNLRPVPPISYKQKLVGAGSRFTSTFRNRVEVGYAYSSSSVWRKTYTESVPK